MKLRVGHIPRKAGVYQCITPSGSYYIGRAADMKERVYQHYAYLKRGEHANQRLQRSYNKYGGRLKWSVLFIADTVQTAIQWEAEYLKMFWGDTKLMNMRTGDGFTAEENERNKRKPVYAMNRDTGQYIKLNYRDEYGHMIGTYRGKRIPNAVYGQTTSECEAKRRQYQRKLIRRLCKQIDGAKKVKPNIYYVINEYDDTIRFVKSTSELKAYIPLSRHYQKKQGMIRSGKLQELHG